jgi:cytochrome P450
MNVKQARVPPTVQEVCRGTDDLLRWMARQFDSFGDIFQAPLHGRDSYVTRNPEFAHHVLVENPQNYVKGQLINRVALLLGDGLMVSEGDLWKRQRRMIQPAFNHSSLAPLIRLTTIGNLRLLDEWKAAARNNESVNVTRDVSRMALEVVLRFIFGNDYEDIKPHFDLLTDEPARNMSFAMSFRALGKIVLRIVARRRERRSDSADALEILMSARDAQTGYVMSERQLVDEVLTLIVAGHETSASTLSWTWYLLSQHPAVEQKLAEELRLMNFTQFEDLARFAYTKQIIEEVMRLYPAGWVIFRRALNQDWFGDYLVPAQTEIYIPLYFIQRHPALWEEPDSFNPDRFQPEKAKLRHRLATIPFSAGPRNCIGNIFARIEMQIHLLTIARELRLRYDQTIPVELDAGVNLRSKHDFVMSPEDKTR